MLHDNTTLAYSLADVNVHFMKLWKEVSWTLLVGLFFVVFRAQS